MFEPYTRSIGIDAIYQYVGAAVQIFSGAIFYICVVRMFNVSTVGALALFLAILGLFNVIFSFGLGNATQHFTSYNIGKGNFPAARRTIFKLIFIGFLFANAGFISLLYMGPYLSLMFFHSHSFTVLVRILSLILFGNVLLGVLNGALLGMQNFKLSALLNIMVWSIYYFGSLIMAEFTRTIETIIIGWVFGIFVGVCVGIVAVSLGIKKFTGQGSSLSNSLIFSYSIPILLSNIITFGANYIDRLIVAGMIGLPNLGVYNLSLMISSSISVITYPFTKILLPKFSELFGKGQRDIINQQVRASSLLLVYFYTPAAILVATLSSPILFIVGGDAYIKGSFSLSIILVVSALFITSYIFFQAIASIRKTRVFLVTSSVALISNAIVSLTLIPIIGINGAALGLSSVFATTFIVLYRFAKKFGLVTIDFTGTAKVWLSTGVMFASIKIIEYFVNVNSGLLYIALPLYALVGSAVYIGFAKLFKVFNYSDKELVKSLFPSKFIRIQGILDVFI